MRGKRILIDFRSVISAIMKSYFKKFPGNLLRGKIPALLRNKYLLATAAFLSWMLFFDDNDIISQVRLRLKLSEYESKKEYYQEKISEVKKEKEELLTNQASLEKFAREQYMMKKDNEDLFVRQCSVHDLTLDESSEFILIKDID